MNPEVYDQPIIADFFDHVEDVPHNNTKPKFFEQKVKGNESYSGGSSWMKNVIILPEECKTCNINCIYSVNT